MATQRRLVEAVEVTDSMIHIIRLKDIFDASTVNEFEKVVSFLLAREFYKIIVDLGQVAFISSAGWGAFTAELRRVRQNHGDIKLANLGHDVFDVFLLLELDSFIQAYESIEEAITAFSSRPATFVTVEEPSELAPPPIIEQIRMARSRAKEQVVAPPVVEVNVPAFTESFRNNNFDVQKEFSVESGAIVPEDEALPFVSGSGDGAESLPEYADGAAGQAEYDFSAIAASGDDGVGVEGQQEYVANETDEVEDGMFVLAPDGEDEIKAPQAYGAAYNAGEIEDGIFIATPNDGDEVEGEQEFAEPGDASEVQDGDFATTPVSEEQVEEQQEYAAYDTNAVQDDRGVNEAGEFGNENTDTAINYENEFAAEEEYVANNGDGEVELDFSAIAPIGEGEIEESGNDLDESGVLGNEAAELPAPGAGGPEMWELLIANEKPVVDPYMFRRRPPLLPEGQAGQDAGKSKAESFGADQQREGPPEAGGEFDFSAHAPVVDDINTTGQFAGLEQNQDPTDQEEFNELISETELHFSGHEPIVEEQISEAANSVFEQAQIPGQDDADETFREQNFELESSFSEYSPTDNYSDDSEGFSEQIAEAGGGSPERAPTAYADDAEEFSGEISEPEGGLGEYAPMAHAREDAGAALSDERNGSATHGYVRAKSTEDEQFDEFETQDIRDPWALEEIDTFPEEYALYENGPIEDEPRSAAARFWSDDSEAEAQLQDWTPNHESQNEASQMEVETEFTPPAESSVALEPEADDTDWGAGSWSMQNEERQATRNSGERQTVAAEAFLQPESLADILPSEAVLSERVQEDESPFAAEVESAAAPAVYDGVPINDDMMALIRDIVAAYPHYGPAMICKHLETHFEPPISISRSTVYRYLRVADLNTLEKRQAFAGV